MSIKVPTNTSANKGSLNIETATTSSKVYGEYDEDEYVNPYDYFCRSTWCERIKLVIASIAVTLLLIVIFVGVALHYSVLALNPIGNFILMFFCLLLLAYVEALHYAVVAVEKWDMSIYQERYPRAIRCHSLVDTPEKVKKFLVGRQFFVIFVVFLLAQITTFNCKKNSLLI